MPILAVFTVIIGAIIFGVPIELGNTLFYVAVTAIIGVAILPTLNFLAKLASQPQIIKFKKCLFLLEQAQTLKNNIEVNKNIA